jgi:hypothetical protein
MSESRKILAAMVRTIWDSGDWDLAQRVLRLGVEAGRAHAQGRPILRARCLRMARLAAFGAPTPSYEEIVAAPRPTPRVTTAFAAVSRDPRVAELEVSPDGDDVWFWLRPEWHGSDLELDTLGALRALGFDSDMNDCPYSPGEGSLVERRH